MIVILFLTMTYHHEYRISCRTGLVGSVAGDEGGLQVGEDLGFLEGFEQSLYALVLGFHTDLHALYVGQGCDSFKEGLDEALVGPRAHDVGLDFLERVARPEDGGPLLVPVGELLEGLPGVLVIAD